MLREMLFALFITLVSSFQFQSKIYCNNFKIPILRKNQAINLTFDDTGRCQLKCNGYLNYQKKGWWDFSNDSIEEMNKKLDNDEDIIYLKRKYLFSLSDLQYDKISDIISIKVKSYLFPLSKRIKLYNYNF